MVEPTDAIRAIHNAFRNDMARIDAAALAQREEKRDLLPQSSVFGSSTRCWSGMLAEKSWPSSLYLIG